MAKKKHIREASPVREAETDHENSPPETHLDNAATATDPLVEEVQSFLDRRAALAQKLADEIQATEKKLAELKKTAALLFPENNAGGQKERTVKKVKSKVTNRAEKTDTAVAASDSEASAES